MTQKVPLTLISPDLRFALADVIAHPQTCTTVGDLDVVFMSCVRAWPMVAACLGYADRDAELVVLGPGGPVGLEQDLAGVTHALGESGELDDLGMAVVLLDAVDSCFREWGLWGGNIYLAGARALAAALQIAGVDVSGCRDPVIVMRELAALELAYLFPVADSSGPAGTTGRSSTASTAGDGRWPGGSRWGARRADRASEFRKLIGAHLAAEHERYASFLAAAGCHEAGLRG